MKSPSKLAHQLEEIIEGARLYRSCLTCDHFTEATEICGLAQGRPPARIIAMGCEKYLQVPPF